MAFIVKNDNIFPLPNNPHILHLATITSSFKEFIVMFCIAGPKKGNTYIEEVVLTSIDYKNDVYANCKFIDDDNLANDLANFAREKGLVDGKKILERLGSQGNFSNL